MTTSSEQIATATLDALQDHASSARARCAEAHNFLVETIARHDWADDITIGQVMSAQETAKAARAVYRAGAALKEDEK